MNINEVDQPEGFDGLAPDWEEVLLGSIVINPQPTGRRTLKDFLPDPLPAARFEHIGEFDEDHDDRMEEIADDELQHREAPSDEEIDAMYEASQTESEAYRLAH